jgi:transmembrane sensor
MQVQKQIDELLALRASEWFELLPTASAQQLRAFDAWLCESRLHVQEFLEIAEVEFCLQRLDPERRRDVDALLERIEPGIELLTRRASAGPFPPSSKHRQWSAIRLGAVCASIALAALFVFREVGAAKQFSTAVGEQKIVELADSSVVTLNADSQIAVDLKTSERQIELLRGEAIFKVTHDARRPFRVHTRAGVIQAVGTQFDVHERVNGDTRVSVLEGQVRLMARAGSKGAEPAQLMLGAGGQADIELDGTIRRHENAVVENSVAWRQRRLVFEDASMEEMVAEFNRYNPTVRLRLEGIEGDVRRYDGVFDSTSPEALAQLLSREPDLKIERKEGEILIRKRAP